MRISNLRSGHGYQMMKFHKHDWLMILFLAIIEGIILLWVPPFYRFVGKDMMDDLRYPFHGNTIPVWSVPIYSIFGPLLIFLIYYYRRKDPNDLHHAILGLLFSIFVTAVITDSIKVAVGGPRPNFFWRCFPDGFEFYDPVTQNVLCTGKESDIKEGHKSFPSGHTSCSFAGLGYLSWYLSGKINLFDRKGHAMKLCIVLFPLLLAALVGISRVDDYWHHWQDVFAGGLLGLTVATLCYRQFFPAPYHADCSLPYPFFPLTTDEHAPDIGSSNVWYPEENKSEDEHIGNYHPYFTAGSAGREREVRGNPIENRSFDVENGNRVDG